MPKKTNFHLLIVILMEKRHIKLFEDLIVFG